MAVDIDRGIPAQAHQGDVERIARQNAGVKKLTMIQRNCLRFGVDWSRDPETQRAVAEHYGYHRKPKVLGST